MWWCWVALGILLLLAAVFFANKNTPKRPSAANGVSPSPFPTGPFRLVSSQSPSTLAVSDGKTLTLTSSCSPTSCSWYSRAGTIATADGLYLGEAASGAATLLLGPPPEFVASLLAVGDGWFNVAVNMGGDWYALAADDPSMIYYTPHPLALDSNGNPVPIGGYNVEWKLG